MQAQLKKSNVYGSKIIKGASKIGKIEQEIKHLVDAHEEK